jgi:hypothetical protein
MNKLVTNPEAKLSSKLSYFADLEKSDKLVENLLITFNTGVRNPPPPLK